MDQERLGREEEWQMTSFPVKISEPVAATEFRIFKTKKIISRSLFFFFHCHIILTLFNTFKSHLLKCKFLIKTVYGVEREITSHTVIVHMMAESEE